MGRTGEPVAIRGRPIPKRGLSTGQGLTGEPRWQLQAIGKPDEIDAGGQGIKITNPNKVLYPQTVFTKGERIDYFSSVSAGILPHLSGRPLTLKRYPDGAGAAFFFEKHCPSWHPAWIRTIEVSAGNGSKRITYCSVDNLASLLWVANLAAIELHPPLSRFGPGYDPGNSEEVDASFLVFDLDPGAPAGILECIEVGLEIRDLLATEGLSCYPKTSGSKGLQVWSPSTPPPPSSGPRHMQKQSQPRWQRHIQQRSWRGCTDPFAGARSLSIRARMTEQRRPSPPIRPVRWTSRRCQRLSNGARRNGPSDVLRRIEERGDIFAPVLAEAQHLADHREDEGPFRGGNAAKR